MNKPQIDQDELRKEIAGTNNVWLSKNDPILQTVTIFENALKQSIATLNEQHEANIKTLIKVVQKGTEETKACAHKVVTQGTEYACDQLSTAITATIDEGREQLRKDIRLAWVKIDEARKAAVFAACASGVCAVLAFAAAFNVI